ncbi:helix-turn-helix domain-containing protein [Aquabacterium sp.]|uniref:helix-turn-helix domain-containing protein n=1 Tax=Aquabacterium sp. TaxID=1872578 RepID=UPI0019961F00|nr:helix-turn-helix domain-containing protein [Aquabacterium sp.]MBC7699809.1 helix-turn-helix domain-containing protein [Aquabacterium sp.]
MIDENLIYQPVEVSPPGDTLRDLMDERALTQVELARRLGRPVQAVNEIMAGKKEITEDTALELERVLQVPAHFWLAREARYREYLARLRDAQGRKAHIPWLERFPIKALQAAGMLPAGRLSSRFKEQLVDDLVRFFGVASPEGWEAHYDKMQAQFRRAKPQQQTDAAAITAWLRMGELAATRLQTADYYAATLEAHLPAMRALSLSSPAEISAGLTRLCSQSGVALVFVPALPGTHVSGVARWVGGKPLIQLSLLGKWNDGFWFSFFHEVGHILKHPTRAVFLDDASSGDAIQSAEEQEANRFATDVLIPRARQAELASLPLNQASVVAFAQSLGVHPGIVVGQLQHRQLINCSHPLSQLKARYTIQPNHANP